MTTYADCRTGVCPCSRPEYPGNDHQCPLDPRSIAEREEHFYSQTNRPYENDEGLPVYFPR